MAKKIVLLVYILFVISFTTNGQVFFGQVFDANTKEEIPFATIKLGTSNSGFIADLYGKFKIEERGLLNNFSIEVSALGYQSKKVNISANGIEIFLQPKEIILSDIIIRPQNDKIRRILKNAITNKDTNNPDKYNQYQCNVYYKLIADATIPIGKKSIQDTQINKFNKFIENQHLLISETYSKRTWQSPKKLQEDILATRISGLQKSKFINLITDVLPFHSYSNYITFYGKDYHNPVSNGADKYYKFNLSDELLFGNDTVWIISFKPKHNINDALKGKVYINSDGYAISSFVATVNDTMLHLTAKIEQEYAKKYYNKQTNKWFPLQLNYIIDWEQKSDKKTIQLHMKGNSRIDSVKWQLDSNFKFDNAHTVRMADDVDNIKAEAWSKYRPDTLNTKEARTYKFIDSLGIKINLDKKIELVSKLPSGLVPIRFFDIDLKRVYSYNNYEGNRVGIGIQTNEKVLKKVSIGAWVGYGFNDKVYKYGTFAEFYADKYKEFVFKIAYNNDIIEPGHISLNHDFDKDYLNSYLLSRVDAVESYLVSVKKKFGYFNIELSGKQESILPKYNYIFLNNGIPIKDYVSKEVSLNIKYAFAERTAPFFGSYYSIGSLYPLVYFKFNYGTVEKDAMQIPYYNIISAVTWKKHINRIGLEQMIIEGGIIKSNTALPLSILFAATGYRYNLYSGNNLSPYAFGGLLTIYPYQFYTDEFMNIIYRHDFDWKIYHLQFGKSDFSSAPNIALQYNYLFGSLSHSEVHENITIQIPFTGYSETGIILNNILRMKYLGLYYFTLNAGYFYHLNPVFDFLKYGNGVIGLGVEL